jgi:hypothetical protein
MAKNKYAGTPDMNDYQAQDDARTLGEAHQMRKGTHPTFAREKEIKGDKKRHAAAKAYAKKEHAKRMNEAAAMGAVAQGDAGAGGGAPDKPSGEPDQDD